MPKFSEQFQLLFDICFTLNYFELLTGGVLLQKNQCEDHKVIFEDVF
jgi:hypothetical protein